jgi:hypothetical protein
LQIYQVCPVNLLFFVLLFLRGWGLDWFQYLVQGLLANAYLCQSYQCVADSCFCSLGVSFAMCKLMS